VSGRNQARPVGHPEQWLPQRVGGPEPGQDLRGVLRWRSLSGLEINRGDRLAPDGGVAAIDLTAKSRRPVRSRPTCLPPLRRWVVNTTVRPIARSWSGSS